MAAEWKTLTPRGKKGIAGLMIAFFIVQVGFDMAHSVTAFPFVHYGMFSERFAPADSLSAFEVKADGQPLRADDFGIYRWDMIQQPLYAFDKLVRSDDFSADKARMKAAAPGLYKLVAANFENDRDLTARFPDWYRRYLSRLLGRRLQTVQVSVDRYRHEASRLVLLKKTPWINCP